MTTIRLSILRQISNFAPHSCQYLDDKNSQLLLKRFDLSHKNVYMPEKPKNYTVFDIKNLYEVSTLLHLTERTAEKTGEKVCKLLKMSKPGLNETVRALDDISNTICKFADILQFFRSMQSIGHKLSNVKLNRTITMALNRLINDLNSDSRIHECLMSSFANKSGAGEVTERVGNLFLADFELNSARCDDSNKHKHRQCHERIQNLKIIDSFCRCLRNLKS
ncbi:hypothetical protein ACOME3_006842 [Neoechinorhynchus agilis]